MGSSRRLRRVFALLLSVSLLTIATGAASAAPPGSRPAVTVSATVTGTSVSVRADANRVTGDLASCTYVLDTNTAQTCGAPAFFSKKVSRYTIALSNQAYGPHTITVTVRLIDGGSGSGSANYTIATTVPGAPTIGTATAGDAQASVTWTAPSSNGGSAITGYVIEAVPAAGGTTVSGAAAAGATSGTVSGLTNGITYRLRVAASNAIGTAQFSGLSNEVTPLAPIGADLSITKNDGVTSVLPGQVVAWQVRATNNGTVTATGVVVTDTIPAGMTVDLAQSSAQWVCSAAGSCTATLAELEPDSDVAYALVATVDAPVAPGRTSITNTASVTDDGSHGVDPNQSNNTASDTDTITLPQMFATAYTDVDGVAGFSAADLLIARLVDTTGNNVLDAGDTVQVGTFPGDLPAGTSRIAAGVMAHVVTSVGPTMDIAVTVHAGVHQFDWARVSYLERYREFDSSFTMSDFQDSTDDGEEGGGCPDFISIGASPSVPAQHINVSEVPVCGDAPYINVAINLPG